MAKSVNKLQRFVVLPTHGLQAVRESVGAFLLNLNNVQSVASAKSFAAAVHIKQPAGFKVLDSIHENGAKLVEMSADAAKDLQAAEPGLRVVPEVFYKIALARNEIESKVKTAAAALQVKISVISAGDNQPVKGAMVVAFTNFEDRTGAQGVTNAQGVVKFGLGGAAKIERLYVYPKMSFWGALKKNVSTSSGIAVKLTPVDLSFTDAVRHYYGNSADGLGAGVTVGIVDTGVGPHPDLVVAGGLNCVIGENPNDFGDNGEGHGSHVGGIVAARGTPPQGIRGLAPGVTLRSYRVFGKDADGASNYSIAKAIDQATADHCDIINLSLGGGPSDPATQSAVHQAREQGAIVIAAAGNDQRSPVSFPGADPLCIAVSCLGRKGTFPKGVVEDGDVVSPFGTDSKEFIAAFSNVGPEIDLTGPGLGIISTVPGGFAPLSGTSMASPAVAGFAARLLAQLPAVLNMARNQDRSDAIAKALLQAAKDRGFTAKLQGNGLPL